MDASRKFYDGLTCTFNCKILNSACCLILIQHDEINANELEIQLILVLNKNILAGYDSIICHLAGKVILLPSCHVAQSVEPNSPI